MKKRLPFRLYTQILLFTALVALGAVILLSLQRVVQRGIVNVRDGLITRLESRIDRKIRYSSISPSFFGSFDVRNVKIMGKDEQPVLSVSRFRVAYSLLDLLRGSTHAIHSVRLDSPYIDFNTTRDQDLIDLFESLQTGENDSGQDLSEILPEKLMVLIRNGKCLVSGGTDQVDLDILNLNAEIAGNRIMLESRWNVGVEIQQLIGTPVSLRTAMRIQGSCGANLDEGEAVLSVISVAGDALSTVPISFALTLQDGVVGLQKMENELPFDFSLQYGIDGRTIDARLGCRDLQLRQYVSFSGALEQVQQLLDTTGSGMAYFVRKADGTLAYSVDMAGAVQVDNLPVQSGGAAFEIKASGDEANTRVESLRFTMPASGETKALFFGEVDFSGNVGLYPFAPAGILSLRDFSLSGQESLNADISVRSVKAADGNEIRAFCESFSLGGITLSAFRALLQPAGNDMGFTVSVNNGHDGSISLEGSLNSETRRIEANLLLDSFLASDLAGMTAPFAQNALLPDPVNAFLGGTAITTEIFLTTDFTHLIYNAPSFAVSGEMGKEFSGSASIAGTDRYFALSEGQLTWGEEVLVMSGRADFAAPGNIAFSINADYRNLGYAIEGVVDGQSVNIQGPYGLNVHLASPAGKGYSGTMYTENFPLPFLGQPALLSLAAQLNYDSAESWSMDLRRFEVSDIISPAGPARIQIVGSADQNGAAVPLLAFSDRLGPLNGGADISWNNDFSSLSATLNIKEGTESYNLSGTWADRHLDLAVSGSSMRLERILENANNLIANGDIAVSWDSVDSFRAEFKLSSLSGRLLEQEFTAEAALVLDQEALTVNRIHVNYAGLEGFISQFRVNGPEGLAAAGARLTGAFGGKSIDGRLALSAAFNPISSWREFNEALSEFDGKIRVEELVYDKGQPQTFEFAFSRSEEALAVSGGPRNMLRFSMDPEGNFYAGLSSPFPVRGTVIGSIKQRMINARCNDLYFDMGELFRLLPESEDFYLTGGYVNASVDIRGSITDPEFFGSARGTSLRIRIPDFMPQELRPIPFTVSIDGNEMRFGPVSTVVGNGAGIVTGWFRFDRWIPNIFSIDIAVPRETPIPYAFDLTGFIASGDVSGKMNISMENVTFDISGDVYGNNTEMGINSDEIAKSQGTNFFADVVIPFVLDLTVTTGPVVEFFYPNSRFPILRANPSMGTILKVNVDSQTEQYSLNSDIKIRSGEIYYFERSFYIRSGTLVFRENELRFDPRLTARAEIRDRNDDGPVTISMIVDNAPLLSFDARFESTPSMSQMEIFTLLGHNLTGDQIDASGTNQRAFLSSTSDLLAQFMLVRQLEQQVGNFMRLDMFSVRTQVLQNAIFMATGLTEMPVDRTAGVGNYFDNTTVFGGKYIGQDMFVQGMLSMRYDENRTDFGGLTFRPDIGVELQNPLFSIRWDFIPTHPENWYVNDNFITLTWSRTF